MCSRRCFSLGTAFTTSSFLPRSQWPIRIINDDDIFVDDKESDYYNQWVSLRDESVSKDWHSYERMNREDGLYEFGMVVNHNMNPVKAGYGSAIFLHLWKHSQHATAGCTAMSKKNLHFLMNWANSKKNPLLVQVPINELTEYVK